jgi:hypothetical protein
MYVNTTSHQGYYWNGTVWVLFGTDTHSFTGAGVPALTTRPNGTALVAGDQYVNTTNNALYFWDGAQWEIISNDTHAFTGTDTALQTTRPDGTPLQTGDLFIDTNNNNHLYYYNAGIWTSVSDDTNSQLANGPTGPLTRADGTALQAGDQWVNKNDGYKLYAWDPAVNAPTGGWVLVATPDTQAYTSATLLTTRPDGSALKSGDQLYLTTTSPWTLKYWDSGLSAWVGEAYQPLLLRTVNPVNGVDSAIFGTVWHNTATLDSWEYVENPASPSNGLWKQLIQEATIQFAAAAPTTQASGLPLVSGDIYYNTVSTLSFIYSTAASAWLPFGNDTHSYPQSAAPVTRPSGSALSLGDKWVDTDFAPAIEYYRSSANTWLPMGDVSTVSALPAAGAYANQLLVNSTNNRLYRYDTTAVAWVQVM